MCAATASVSPVVPRGPFRATGVVAHRPLTTPREERPSATTRHLALRWDTTVSDPARPEGLDERQAALARISEERARRTLTLGAIRAHLEEQPSDSSILVAARSWCRDVTNLADAVIAARNSTEPE